MRQPALVSYEAECPVLILRIDLQIRLELGQTGVTGDLLHRSQWRAGEAESC